jgi:flagellar L-ring protein precursor FlgH
MKSIRLLLSFAGALSLGTAGANDQDLPLATPPIAAPVSVAPKPAPAPVPAPVPVPASKESLYAEGGYMALTSDRRLRRVGDLVTVVIYENASATSSADTGSARDADVGFKLDAPARSRAGGLSTNNDFTAGGKTQRAGKVLAQLTVTVRDIAPNQDLLIAGEQLLEINGEKQAIRLEGRVRQRDITEQNTVLSTRVADAKIGFVGEGVLGDKQKPAWWQRFLTLFGF